MNINIIGGNYKLLNKEYDEKGYIFNFNRYIP